MDFLRVLAQKRPDQTGAGITGSKQTRTYLHALCPCNDKVLKIPKCGSPEAGIRAAPCDRRPRSEASVNNRRSLTKPPANQRGVAQQAHQSQAELLLGAGPGAFPGVWDKPLCFGRPALISAAPEIWWNHGACRWLLDYSIRAKTSSFFQEREFNCISIDATLPILL